MANLQAINIFLRAKRPEDLASLQLANNEINGIQYAYQTPVWTGKDWVIWFYADIKSWHDPNNINEDARKLAREINE